MLSAKYGIRKTIEKIRERIRNFPSSKIMIFITAKSIYSYFLQILLVEIQIKINKKTSRN